MISDQEIKADQIVVIETGLLTTQHVFQFGGGILGVLNLKPGKSAGNFQGEDKQEYHFTKPNIWKPQYEWKEHKTLLGSASSKSVLSRVFLINFRDINYGLFPGGSKFRSWTLKDSSSRVLCEFIPRGAFKRGAIIRIKSEFPFGLLVFCYCLVVKRWQEQSS